MRSRLLTFVLVGLVCVWMPRLSMAAEKQAQYIRFVDDNDGGGVLQTAIVTYTNAAGVKVHLVAAVHVADGAYYKELAKTFGGYEVLLYEMVKPKDMDVPRPGGGATSAVGFIQQTLKDVLELDYQLDAIDYSAKNFVHADLTTEEFEHLQSERGESMFTIILQEMLRQFTNPQATQAPEVSELTVFELLLALTSSDRARHMKLLLAREFDQVEEQLAGMGGTVILTERNKTAVAAIQKAVAGGRRNIGLFYGAAHMPGIAEALEAQGFTRAGTEWRTAWDMTAKPGDIIIKRAGQPAPTRP
jgi:hypothetical protein